MADELTIAVLKEIRDAVRANGARLDDVTGRLDETNTRLGNLEAGLGNLEAGFVELASQQAFTTRKFSKT